jgi:uncharacterized protein YukE
MDINIPYEVLEHVEGELKSMSGTLQSELGDLVRTLDAMHWTGVTHDLYQTKKTQWQAAANNMQEVCGQMAVAVGAHHENAKATESHNSRSWV